MTARAVPTGLRGLNHSRACRPHLHVGLVDGLPWASTDAGVSVQLLESGIGRGLP